MFTLVVRPRSCITPGITRPLWPLMGFEKLRFAGRAHGVARHHALVEDLLTHQCHRLMPDTSTLATATSETRRVAAQTYPGSPL